MNHHKILIHIKLNMFYEPTKKDFKPDEDEFIFQNKKDPFKSLL